MRKILSSSLVVLTALVAPSVALAQSPVGGGSGETSGATDAPATAAPEAAKTTAPVADVMPEDSITDVTEKEHKTYYFVGARYRGTVIPKFMVNIFVGEGATFYSNTAGIEVDIRKDNFSLIPALNFVEYGFDSTAFFDKSGKGAAANEGNWSIVHSNLKGVYLTLDLLWSAPVHKNISFEYGLGVGVGVLFGDIYNNWATKAPNNVPTAITHAQASDGTYYNECQTVNDGAGCKPTSHTSPDPAKVGGYTEKTWAGGGSIPNVFLHLALPQLGLRIKPIKQMEMRIGGGFSLTGFWFGLSGDYGFETTEKKPAHAAQ